MGDIGRDTLLPLSCLSSLLDIPSIEPLSEAQGLLGHSNSADPGQAPHKWLLKNSTASL